MQAVLCLWVLHATLAMGWGQWEYTYADENPTTVFQSSESNLAKSCIVTHSRFKGLTNVTQMLPVSLFNGGSAFFDSDIMTDMISQNFEVVTIIWRRQGHAHGSSLEELVETLSLNFITQFHSVDLRLANRTLVVIEGGPIGFHRGMTGELSAALRGRLASYVFGARAEKLLQFRTHKWLNSTEGSLDGVLRSVLSAHRESSPARFLLALPFHGPLYITIHAYSILHAAVTEDSFAFAFRHAGPLGSLKELGHEGVLVVNATHGIAFPVKEDRRTKKSNSVFRLPHHTRWFLSEHGPEPLISDRCKTMLFKYHMCSIPSAPQQDRGKYLWECSLVHPLAYYNPAAYRKPDTVSAYVSAKVTILITDHLVPSAPSTLLLRILVQSIQIMPELRNCRIVIIYDGLKPTANKQTYQQHIANIESLIRSDPLFAQSELIALQVQGHLANQMEYVLPLVKTPYIYVLQPDLPFIRRGSLYYLLRTMEANAQIKHVKFNKRANVPLAFDIRIDSVIPNSTSFTPLQRTQGWSSQNHLCSTDYYPRIVFPRVMPILKSGEKRTMENIMHTTVTREHSGRGGEAVHNNVGTFVYGYFKERAHIIHVDGSENHQHIPAEYKQPF